MPTASADLIARRYLQEAVLGRGGAGEVFRVRDTANGNTLALKRLSIAASSSKYADLSLLFEREYHTLAQLAHPCIIAVYDYGVEAGAPYYTMELLDGSDLLELAPLPWQKACALLCDVASSLALLHSRRLVHRDLTPRNVRCTSDGRAKLFDFGAMAAMGHSRHLVGTAAYVAPEQASGQELDARTDLYGLGALAYWTLTGRNAFRARSFKDLVDSWRTRPSPPSTIVADIPPDLDALVMSLLSFDPAGRPQNAAEVMGRLRALSDQPADDTLEIAHAYLATPTLVGRSDQQLGFRRLMLSAMRGHGGSVLIEGGPGMGRSRLLASLMLEAKLAGALALSATASGSANDEFRVVRELVEALLESAPQLARETVHAFAGPLAAALPALDLPVTSSASDSAVLDALLAWFQAMSRVQPLCIAVDELPRADAQSAAFLGRLAAQSKHQRIVVAASADPTESHALVRTLDQLVEHGERIALEPLSPAESEALLRSIFGTVANLPTIAAWIHRVGEGRPGACLELAQHLVDQGIARFADGAWTLPKQLDGLLLPSSFEQALELRFSTLTPCARALAQLLSLVSPLAALGLSDHLELLEPSFSHQQIFLGLDELLRAQLLTQTGESHALRDGALRRIVEHSLDPEASRHLHARLARHYERHLGAQVIVGFHWLHAGEWRRSFEIHRVTRERATDLSDVGSLFARTAPGIAYLEALYEQARDAGLSAADLYPLQKHLIQLAAVADPSLARHVEHLLPRLTQDSGFIYFSERPELEPLARAVYCVQRAQERYDLTPIGERGLAPLDAIRELAVTAGILTGVYSRVVDVERVAQLPALLKPFVPLSPVIELLHELIDSAIPPMLHGSDVRVRRQRVIDQMSRPLEGVDELTRQGMHHVLSFYQGLDYAICADKAALALAEVLDHAPNYAPLASQIRVVYCQNVGDLSGAEEARQERDSRAVLNVDADTHLTPSIFYETTGVLLTGDLVASKRMVDTAAREAARFPGWKPWHAFCVALFESIRGNSKAALAAVDECIALCPAVGHAAGVVAVIIQVELLARVGEAERAVAIGRDLLARREAAADPLDSPTILLLSLAYAETLASDYPSGAARLDRLIAEREASGLGGLELAVLYAQRARIALLAADGDAFEHSAVLAAQASERLRHPALVARLQQLVSSARSADQPVGPELARGAELTVVMTGFAPTLGRSFFEVLGPDARPEQRAGYALDVLIRSTKASGGYLFGTNDDAVRLLASSEVPPVDSALLDAVAQLIASANVIDDEDATRIEPHALADWTTEPVAVSQLQHRGCMLQPFTLRATETANRTALGVVLLAPREGELSFLQESLASAICDALVRAGDLAALGQSP